MKNLLKDTLIYLSFVAMVFSITYMMVYAWDKEAEYQEQKEQFYYEQSNR